MPFEPITLNDGRKMPSIAFGTGSAFSGKDATSFVIQAIEAGFSGIDTAQSYKNEASVGRALNDTAVDRADVFVTTKWSTFSDAENLGPKACLKQSLEKLALNYVDLYLIHSPRGITDRLESVWLEFEQCLKEGLTRGIGISNIQTDDLRFLLKHARVTPAVNQISFNPYKLSEQANIVAFCQSHGIAVQGYSPLAPLTRHSGGPVDVPVTAIAERLGATPGQVLLKWVHAKGIGIVTTSSKKERLAEYLDAGDLPPLTDDEIAAIDAAGKKGPPTSLLGNVSGATLVRIPAIAALFLVLYTVMQEALK